MARVALYVRVSTDQQTTHNQKRELDRWAEFARHTIVDVFEDQGISGAKGRDKRPGLDAALKAAVRRKYDILAVWSSDRLGRNLRDLLETLQTIRDNDRGLYIHTQSLDTTTSSGRAMFQMLGVFAEFEREQIRDRVNAGLARARANGKRPGPRRRNGYTDEALQAALREGKSVRQVSKLTGASVGKVSGVRKVMVAAKEL